MKHKRKPTTCSTHKKNLDPAPDITIGYVFGSKRPGRWQLEGDRPEQCEYTPEFLATLTDDQKRWLGQFLREYYDGDVKKGDRRAFHRARALRTSCYERNNLAYRDLSNVTRAQGALEYLDALPPENEDEERPHPLKMASAFAAGPDPEGDLIDALDQKRKQEARVKSQPEGDQSWPSNPKTRK